MKILPISNHERALMIQLLAEFGNWEGTRYGAHVRLVRFATKTGNRIQYTVGFTHRASTSGKADTVALAIDEINRLILCAPIHGTRHKRAIDTDAAVLIPACLAEIAEQGLFMYEDPEPTAT